MSDMYEVKPWYEVVQHLSEPKAYIVQKNNFVRGGIHHRQCGIGEEIARFPRTELGKKLADEFAKSMERRAADE